MLNKNKKTNTTKLYSENRLIYQGGPVKPASAEKIEAPAEEEEWREINAMAEFQDSVEKTLDELARKADPDNAEEYAQRIKNSLDNYMSTGKSLENLWKYLKKQNCKYLAIIQGLLNFFKSKNIRKKGNKIDINKFFTLQIAAQSPEEKDIVEKNKGGREKVSNQTKIDRISFLKEMIAGLPKETFKDKENALTGLKNNLEERINTPSESDIA